MMVTLKDGEREVTLQADDALMDVNPWYRESIQKQVAHLTEVFYAQKKTGTPT